MAITFRSVLAAARAILQNKTVTAGTSDITVQADSGYDGLGTVTVQPTPTEAGSCTPTTSAQTITPSSGKYLSSVSVGAIPSEYVVPTNITLSNSSSVSLTSGSAYKPDTNGYAIQNYSSITPSSSSPGYMAKNRFYRTNNNGYAIDTYQNITPASGGTSFNEGMVKMSQGGYAYAAQPSFISMVSYTGATASSNSKPGTVYTYNFTQTGTYLIVVSAATNCSNTDGYLKIINDGDTVVGTSYYISTWGSSSSSNSVQNDYKIRTITSTSQSVGLYLSWDNSHTSVYFKYSVNIFKIS